MGKMRFFSSDYALAHCPLRVRSDGKTIGIETGFGKVGFPFGHAVGADEVLLVERSGVIISPVKPNAPKLPGICSAAFDEHVGAAARMSYHSIQFKQRFSHKALRRFACWRAHIFLLLQPTLQNEA